MNLLNTTQSARRLGVTRQTMRRLGLTVLPPDERNAAGKSFWSLDRLDSYRLGKTGGGLALMFFGSSIDSLNLPGGASPALTGRRHEAVRLSSQGALATVAEIASAIQRLQPSELLLPKAAIRCSQARTVTEMVLAEGIVVSFLP